MTSNVADSLSTCNDENDMYMYPHYKLPMVSDFKYYTKFQLIMVFDRIEGDYKTAQAGYLDVGFQCDLVTFLIISTADCCQ